ncbi:phage repressor protein CI [Erwinia aphidicola]|uniref:phage repressor protein CI n=1 Tax=Erwinia aphidicola TaxID=68334 RepID=UPI00209D794F|nr:phage repressor protein CI [Erwinia aphidicola]MCP2231822.1 phage repressor protein C with HTH and peptisase S24 domain [Erwinia aphidicola]
MTLLDKVNSVELLERVCEVYGFSQKIQLARHFKIAPSSLQNRFSRGTISYDFAIQCSLETGASIKWILTGEGPKFLTEAIAKAPEGIKEFTLRDGSLIENSILSIDRHLFTNPIPSPICVRTEGKVHFIDQNANLSDGIWLVDMEGSTSIRELTLLPAKRLHVAGGKVPFECSVEDIKTLGRVVGIYSEVN